MPGWLGKAALIAYGVVCLAFQLRLSADWLLKESTESERARRPFNIRFYDHAGEIDSTLPTAREAGLAKGDRILEIDGQPYMGAGTYYRALDSHRAGERLRVRVRRQSESADRDAEVLLRRVADEGESWGARDLVDLGVSQILTPLLSLGLGLLVLVRRPMETLSWAVFAFLVSFSILGSGGLSYDPVRMICQWEPGVVRVLALGHVALWLFLWPVMLFVFATYFPQPAEWHVRRPWLLPLVMAPAVAHAILRGVALPAGLEALPTFRGLVQFTNSVVAPIVFTYFAVICVVATFLESVRKLRAASDPDTRRRLRILLAASALAWTPFLGMLFAQGLFGIRSRGWGEIIAMALLLIFPVTLVYLILVDRAMDVGVTIREGLQYAVARRGLYVVQFLVVFGLIVVIAIDLGKPGMSLPKRMQRLGFGIAAAMMSRRLLERAGQWVDRRFFREQYQAGQLLTELAQQAGETADRDRLRDLVTSRIGSTLHTSAVHLIDHGSTTAFAGTLSRLSQERRPQSIDWRRPADWVSALEAAEGERLREMHTELLFPVARQNRLLGFLSLGPRRSEQPYSASDVAVLESVASQTALALDNARLAETIAHESASREVLNRELHIAREVQERLLPRSAPAIPGLDVAGICVPAREVGGDLFDYVALPNGEWAVAVGDVAGKGVSASLIMASLQASVRGLAADGIDDLPELMTRLNRLTYDSTPSNRFATFQIGVFQPGSRCMRMCSAGHNPALHLVAGDGGAPRWIRPKGVALGLVKQASYEQMEVTLGPGDLLLFYTDGVTEAMNPAGELFGEERLGSWAVTAAGASSLELARDLVARVTAFAGTAPQHDDITIIVIR
jgi:phosphoserine phosphatase RsbU/P